MNRDAPWIIIPARYGSERLPGKPLHRIGDTPLVLHVWAIARGLVGADRAIVATDDRRVFDVVDAAGGRVLMTSPEHMSGSDRAAEVATRLELRDDALLVNLQGDEPLLPAELITRTVSGLAGVELADIATLACPIDDTSDVDNPNIVKVVLSGGGQALYFSRRPIPYRRAPEPSLPTYRHIGLYAYRVGALRRLSKLPVAALERAEGLEQLRALAAGMHIHVSIIEEAPPHGVDTPEDLERVRAIMEA